ncbi:hypothetical protein [Wolbachia endosymbiont (group A) of Agelastica alni]|uniref:hypothetical protein n=1 Tax=Wolbachia endosymbiont (group A) of Agelastica alni TaxID=3066130 RepID=UPI00334276BB
MSGHWDDKEIGTGMTPLGTTVIKEPVSVTWMTPFFFLDSSVWALPSWMGTSVKLLA